MRRRIPSTTALLCFEAAAATENFARAAEHLHLTQSALSRQIQILEQFYSQPLFLRARQRVTLTSAGKQLAAELSPLLQNLEMLQLTMVAHNEPGGAINLGIYPTLGSRWLMPRLGKLFQTHDNLTVNTITYLSNEELDPSLVDIAITQGDPPFTDFREDYLMPESLIVVAAKSYKEKSVVDPHELLSLRCLQHTTRPETWQIWFDSIGLKLAHAPTGPMFSQFEMLIDAVTAGHGIAIIPHVLIKAELLSGELVKIHDHECTPQSAYYLLTPKVKIGIQKIERVRDWFLNESNQSFGL